MKNKNILEADKLQVKKEAAERWKAAGISNDFIFCKVMQNKKLLSELVHLILPELVFDKIRIEPQKVVEEGWDVHGVRFDIFGESDSGDVIEVEMQVADVDDLNKRIRYYEAMSDFQLLRKGQVYSELKDLFLIMICPFDLFEMGRHVYTFTSRCKEDPDIEMADGVTKIVLNAVGTMDDVSKGLKNFLDYVAGKASEGDEYIEKLKAAVKRAKSSKKWRAQYMKLTMRDLENRNKGRKEGMQAGRVLMYYELQRDNGCSEEESIREAEKKFSLTEKEVRECISMKFDLV